MTRLISFTFVLLTLVSLAAVSAEEKKQSKDQSGLEVLSNYLGTWETVSGPKDKSSAKGRYTAKWVLNGRFIQISGSLKTADGSNDFALVSMATFNPFTKKYQFWDYMSNGMVSQAEGTWDAKTKTMTRVYKYGEITQTAVSTFSKAGVENFELTSKDKTGKIVNQMSGTNTRVNVPPAKLSTAQPEHGLLKRFVGEWEYEKLSAAKKGEKPNNLGSGKMKGEMLGKFFVVNRWSDNDPEKKFNGIQTLGFDVYTNEYAGSWVDTILSYRWECRGKVQAETKELIIEAGYPGPDGQTMRFRDRFQFKSEDSIDIISESFAGKSWVQFMTTKLSRKNSKPSK